ncbi:ATP-binding protein [Sediminispirochaeta bajacaliforniensis]|uniref:ATP-binding protein n=1 Tax=Sediminispirochaeta bajacaliforniensis TaxID=148 RepID=UPI00036AE1F6|nr:ATP-binding protein [Sediminispirochaeta bajacaliforniensis]
MDIQELLFQYNPWWVGTFSTEGFINRTSYFEKLKKQIDSKPIIFLTGLRRVGKTTLMKILIDYMTKSGIDRNHIFYVSLDDYSLSKMLLSEILIEYRKIHKLSFDEKIYVFFDEITYKDDYHQQLKNIYDNQNVKLFVTSSSSSLLRDKKAFLTGRALTYEVKPLDFNEYLKFKGIEIKGSETYLLDSYFRDYMKEGGMPENVLEPSREYLMSLIDDIIQKDITAFNGLRNHQIVREYYTLLMERSGKQLSINKIANILKLSVDTARRYLGYFEDTFLVHLLPRYGKTNERLLSAKKLYACDLGIKHLFIGDRDLGSYFENYIYLKMRNNKELFYVYENGYEIDFITDDKILIESKYNSEIKGKQKILFDEFDAKEKYVIDSVKKLKILENFEK